MQDEIFDPVERQVIALAAGSASRECGGTASGPVGRFAASAMRLLTGAEVRPLANPRLEALRRLACAAFATGGRAGERVMAAAREAGLSQEQSAELTRLASARTAFA